MHYNRYIIIIGIGGRTVLGLLLHVGPYRFHPGSGLYYSKIIKAT